MLLPSFDAATHTYIRGDKIVLSVTQIMKRGGIVDTTGYTEFSRDRGTAVHKAVNLMALDSLDEASLDDRIKPYLAAFQQFQVVSHFELIASEMIVYSAGYNYAGTLDLYGKINNHPAIIDIKTGSIPSWAGIQLSAYLYAGIECDLVKANSKRFALLLTDIGKFKLKEQTGNDFPAFLKALEKAKEIKE
jgi:hypothetical protein